MRTTLPLLAAAVLAGSLSGCGSDHDDEAPSGPLAAIFFWAWLLGGAGKTLAEPVASLEGAVPGPAVEVRWVNETTGAQGPAEGTTRWTARVPLVPGVNVVTVTAWDAAGNFDSSSCRVVYDGEALLVE